MAVATIDGNQVNLPDFAMDNTIKELSRKMDGYAKSNEALLKKIMSGKGTSGDADKGSKKIDEAVKRQVRAIESSRSAMGPFEKALTGAANAVGMMTASFITGISAFTGILTGIAIESFMKFGSALNELTTVGLNQSMLEMGDFTTKTMALGMTFDEATSFVKENSMAFQEMGSGAFDFAIAFMNATDSGVKLGLALDDTIGVLNEELQTRARLGNMNNLTEQQQERVASSLADMTRTQLEYTQALGMSIDAIRMFGSQLVQDSAPLAAALIDMGEELRQNTITEVQKFGSVLAATGGNIGQSLAEAATEAAAFGAIGFSASAREFITVLPQLAGPFQNVINDFRNGVLDGEEAALAFTNTLGNLNNVEKERIFAIARTGNQQALAMAKSILLFEQSAQKLSRIAGREFRPESIQQAYNLLGTVPRTLLSTIDAVKNNFLIKFLDLMNSKDGVNGFLDSVTALKESLVKLATTFMDGPFGGTDNPLQGLADFFESIINNIRDRITTFDARMNKYFSKEEGGTIGTFFTEFIEEPFHALLRTVMMNIERMVKTIGPNFVAVGEDLAFALLNALKDLRGPGGIKLFNIDKDSKYYNEQAYEKHSADRDAKHQEKLKNLDEELLLKYFKENPNNTYFQSGRTSAVYDAQVNAGLEDQVLIDSSGMVQTPANSLIKGASGGFYNLYEGGNVSMDSINALITARRQGGDAIETLLANIADPDQRARASRKIDDVMGGQDLTSFADTDGDGYANGEELLKALNVLIRVSKDQTRVIQDGQ